MEFPILYACRYVDDLFCYVSSKYNLGTESPLGISEVKEFIPRTFTEHIAETIQQDKYLNEALEEARMFDFDFNVYFKAGCYASYYLYGFCQRLLDFKPLGGCGVLYVSAFMSQLCVYCVERDNQEALYNTLCTFIGVLLSEKQLMNLRQWSTINAVVEFDLRQQRRR